MQSTPLAYFLPAVVLLVAILYTTSPAVAMVDNGRPDGSDDSADASLDMLLRRRFLEGVLRGPPVAPASLAALYSNKPVAKRGGDEVWIWMPAHGYVPVPSSERGAKDFGGPGEYRVANLMRHGRRRRR